ncbi:hypothetical protein FRB94_011936 [Tulasnella sp. JGI-2019a]|nr:hypothetical protein FRB94_011936 [Tulasnella sp. JGI-2019a]
MRFSLFFTPIVAMGWLTTITALPPPCDGLGRPCCVPGVGACPRRPHAPDISRPHGIGAGSNSGDYGSVEHDGDFGSNSDRSNEPTYRGHSEDGSSGGDDKDGDGFASGGSGEYH